jgi:hypothetical protein
MILRKEHIIILPLGKGEVESSIPSSSTRFCLYAIVAYPALDAAPEHRTNARGGTQNQTASHPCRADRRAHPRSWEIVYPSTAAFRRPAVIPTRPDRAATSRESPSITRAPRL